MLVKLIGNPVSPVKCLILRIILSKNYILPHKTIDLLVDFFITKTNEQDCLQYRAVFLVFLKNYSIYLSDQDKKKILDSNNFKNRVCNIQLNQSFLALK